MLKKYFLLSVSIILFLISVVGVYWYLAFGGIENKADAYKLGVIDKLQVRGSDTYINLTTGNQIGVKSKELVLIEMSKEQEKKELAENDYVPAYVYYVSTEKRMETNFAFKFLAKYNQFNTYKDKVVYMTTKKDLDNFQKSVSNIPRYSSLDDFIKDKNTDMPLNTINKLSDSEKKDITTKVYSLSTSTYSDGIYYSPVVILSIILLFTFTHIGVVLFSKDDEYVDDDSEDEYTDDDYYKDLLNSETAQKEPELENHISEKKLGLKEINNDEGLASKIKKENTKRKEKDAEFNLISQIVSEDKKGMQLDNQPKLSRKEEPKKPLPKKESEIKKENEPKLDIDSILNPDNEYLDTKSSDGLEIKHFKRRRKY